MPRTMISLLPFAFTSSCQTVGSAAPSTTTGSARSSSVFFSRTRSAGTSVCAVCPILKRALSILTSPEMIAPSGLLLIRKGPLAVARRSSRLRINADFRIIAISMGKPRANERSMPPLPEMLPVPAVPEKPVSSRREPVKRPSRRMLSTTVPVIALSMREARERTTPVRAGSPSSPLISSATAMLPRTLSAPTPVKGHSISAGPRQRS